MDEFTHEASQYRAKKENIMKKNRKIITGMVAVTGLALAIVIGSSSMFGGAMDKPVEVADNEMTGESGQIMASVAVNIEGVIEEVSEDGMSFRIEDTWVLVTEETELGISGPTAAPEDEQYMSDKFEVGNSIAGFTQDDEGEDRVTAYAIYINWNWDNN
jgi:hypothetical protein